MSNVRALRLRAAAIDADFAQREERAEAKLEEVRCACDRPHLFAAGELAVIKGGTVIEDGKKRTLRIEGGTFVKRLVAAPDGFTESAP